LVELKFAGDGFIFEDYVVIFSPQRDRTGNPSAAGGAALMYHRNVSKYFKGNLDDAPQEVAAAAFAGELFNTSCDVAVVVAYVRPGASEMFENLSDFLWGLRDTGFDILLMGDFNAYTKTRVGWHGNDPLWSEGVNAVPAYSRLSRASGCGHEFNDAGYAFLHMLEVCELTILNGLNLGGLAGSCDVTRPRSGRATCGSVIDYYLASEAVMLSITSGSIVPQVKWRKANREKALISDHCGIALSWQGKSLAADHGSEDSKRSGAALYGWKFAKLPTLETQPEKLKRVKGRLASRLTVDDAHSILNTEGADGLHEKLLSEVRDVWRFAGATVRVDDGVRGELPDLRVRDGGKIHVKEFWDDDIRKARDAWADIRRTSDRAAAVAARKEYDAVVEAKEARYREKCADVWFDDSSLSHTEVWKKLKKIRGGGQGSSCMCPASQQSQHFAGVSYCLEAPGARERLAEAQDWLRAFLASQEGVGAWSLSSDDIKAAFHTLKQSAASIDGNSKRTIAIFLSIILLWVVPLFQFLALTGTVISVWRVSVLVAIIKRGISKVDMNNFRGIHVLQFLRQWFAACTMPELLRVACAKVSQLQQGFIKGRKMWVAFMSLYAIIEAGRCEGRTVFVTFLDVRKAFPSVCREILWKELHALGVNPGVIRTLIALYEDTEATIRAPEGYGEPFLIRAGTREGGVESPLLYILYIASMLEALENAELQDGTPLLLRRRAPALMVADDLALLAYSIRDMQCLLNICEASYRRLLSAINLDKTRAVPFEPLESKMYSIDSAGNCHKVTRPGSRLRKYGLEQSLIYESNHVQFARQYIYLGLVFCWNSSPASCWEMRDSSAVKALGCFKVCMTGFFFLPFYRICQLLHSLVFTVYLYGAELWAPFSSKSTVHARAVQWLFGFPKIKLERMVGWFPLDSPEDIATSRALKAIFEAREGGLLGDAIGALIKNFDNAGAARRETWYCKLQLRVRKVWPNFEARVDPSSSAVGVRGIPFSITDLTPKVMAKQFVSDASRAHSTRRFNSLLSSPPSISQQDYILFCILNSIPRFVVDALPSVFPKLPNSPQYCVRDLVKLLSGTGGFARVHANFEYRHKKGIALSENDKRACLICLLERMSNGAPSEPGCNVMDSEWHCIFECGATAQARLTYRTAVVGKFAIWELPWDPTVGSLVSHVHRARESPEFLVHFAKCVATCLTLRHKALHKVSIPALRSALSSATA